MKENQKDVTENMEVSCSIHLPFSEQILNFLTVIPTCCSFNHLIRIILIPITDRMQLNIVADSAHLYI